MKIVVDGQLIEYSDEGRGDVLVLLHGWGASLGTFDTLAKELSTQYRVIRFDFPGFGKSPKPSDDWDVSAYTRLTAEVLNKLKIEKVHALIGHSFGGRVIIKSQSLKLIKADKIILMGAAGIRPKTSLKRHGFMAMAKVGKVVTALPGLRSVRKKLRQKLYAAAGSEDYLQSQAMQPIFLNTIKEDLSPELSAVAAPTLLVWGEQDDQTPVSDAFQMKDSMEQAKLIVIAGAGHFVYADAFIEVKEKIKAFLG